jgi:alkylated DNA nucleotide flippase Atl1
MAQSTFLQKVMTEPASSFHTLEPSKAKRMNAATMFIPSPADVAKVIQAIPHGQTKTLLEIRKELAVLGNAETACPAKTVVYWKWLAAATEELAGQSSSYSIPWWRVLKDGQPSRHMPGGVMRQVALLQAEGAV